MPNIRFPTEDDLYSLASRPTLSRPPFNELNEEEWKKLIAARLGEETDKLKDSGKPKGSLLEFQKTATDEVMGLEVLNSYLISKGIHPSFGVKQTTYEGFDGKVLGIYEKIMEGFDLGDNIGNDKEDFYMFLKGKSPVG